MLVRVTSRKEEALDIVSLELRSEVGSLPRFSAGAHIDLHIKPGLVRQYSICNHPSENDRYLLAILRDPNSRGGSRAIHDTIKQSDLVEISEPRNQFPLVPASKVLLMAGGIGITPIICMAEWLWHTGVAFEMHYCTRSPNRTAFRERIATSAFGLCAAIHYDDGEAGQKVDLADVLRQPSNEKHLYICGPAGFIGNVAASAKSQGWSERNVHTEFFAAAPSSSADTAFNVKILSSDQVITIPCNEPVTTVLARHGIHIPVSCELGVCGSCLTRVSQGEPDHRDVVLTDEERAKNDRFTPCCSRAKSPMLVLDL